MERWIAGFLQLMAAILFFVVGAEGDDALLLVIPAVVSGVSGLLLWNRQRSVEPVIPPKPEPRALEGKVDRIEDALTALQADITQLREDREFFRELYADPAQKPGLKSPVEARGDLARGLAHRPVAGGVQSGEHESRADNAG